MIDPGTLMAKIEDSAAEIDEAGKLLAAAIHRASEAEIEYEQAKQEELIRLHGEYRLGGKREKEKPPAADLRAAMAHQRIDSAVYGNYLLTKATTEALKARLKSLEASTSARQSLLATMRDELRVAA